MPRTSSLLSMTRYLAIVLLACCCGSENKPEPEQMPVASSWEGTAAVMPATANDPHAGLDMGSTSDPHAGLDMSGQADGFVAPNPNRVVNPKMFVSGRIETNPQTKALVQAGATVFVSVRPINGKPGQTLAVELYKVRAFPVEFYLSGAQSMVAGTVFSGDVEVYARVDGDGEASTVLPGDVEGRVLATIPVSGLSLVLDTVL